MSALSALQLEQRLLIPLTDCGTSLINAELTDNGSQVCSASNVPGAEPGCSVMELPLACDEPYSALFLTDTSSADSLHHPNNAYFRHIPFGQPYVCRGRSYYQINTDGCS
jgi:hypothetical protein